MSYIVADVEADGPIPHKYSMVCFGAVTVEPSLSKTFYGKTRPISNEWIPEALAISGFTREEHEQFEDPAVVMRDFESWLKENTIIKCRFVSDNLAFDWQWINYYFHYHVGSNPFGYSGRRLGDLYCGMKMNAGLNREWKWKYRNRKHDHNPVNDSMGNAEALLAFQQMGLKISLK